MTHMMKRTCIEDNLEGYMEDRQETGLPVQKEEDHMQISDHLAIHSQDHLVVPPIGIETGKWEEIHHLMMMTYDHLEALSLDLIEVLDSLVLEVVEVEIKDLLEALFQDLIIAEVDQ